MFRKPWPILYSKLQPKMGQDFLDKKYSYTTHILYAFHIFILILAFCGMHILYFSLELKWGATKCPMVCKVGEKCLLQWGNGHNNFYLLLFFLRKPSKISLTFNLITLSFLTKCKKFETRVRVFRFGLNSRLNQSQFTWKTAADEILRGFDNF